MRAAKHAPARVAAGDIPLASPELRWIYDTAPIGLAFLSPDCRYLQINQRLTDICGISVEGHLGRTVRETVPKLADAVEALVKSIVANGEAVTGIEVNGQRADGVGADRCWLTNWYPLKAPDGRVLGVNVAAEEITERKRALNAVAASEARYRALVRATSSLVWTATADGQFIESPEWCAFTGQSPDEAAGTGWLDALYPYDRDVARDVRKRAIENTKPFETEYRIRRHDGVYVWHHVRGNAVLEADGSVREWVGICIDIDERKAAAEQRKAFHRSVEQALQLLVSVSAAASAAPTTQALAQQSLERICQAQRWHFGQVWYPGPSGRLTCGGAPSWSAADFTEFRRTSAASEIAQGHDLPGRVWDTKSATWFEDVSFAPFPRLRPALDADLKTALVFPVILDDEVLAVFECYSREKRPPDRTILGTVDQLGRIVGDIWARHKAQSDLSRTATYLAEAEKLSHTGFWSRKVATGELFWSPEEWKIFGIDPSATETSLDLFLALIHPEDRLAFEEASARAIREKKPYDVTYRAVLPDGTLKHIHTVGHPVLDNAGEVTEMIGVSMDETERVRANAALQEAQAELARVARLTTMGELAASIAHEINQPLAAVVANGNAALRWLDRATPDLAEAKEALEGVVEEGNRASQVIGRIRAFLRNRKPDYAATDINDAIREVLALTMNTLRGRNVTVQTSLPREVPMVLGDRVQLQQVIMNLVINGADAMNAITGRSRILRIGSALDGGESVLVTVGDSGTGIDESIRSRVFDPLFTTKSTGMGMGLPICRGIVQAHGGRLWAAPATPHGTEFHFTVPVAARAGERSEQPARALS
jgi:PAS domain S-box-containing protein